VDTIIGTDADLGEGARISYSLSMPSISPLPVAIDGESKLVLI